MTDSIWRRFLDQTVDSLLPEMVRVRRHLHMYPEVSGAEWQTTEFLRRELAELDCQIRVGPDGRGLIVDQNRQTAGPRVALRADIDGLPIGDQKNVEYRSRINGVMHACGHDAHSAILYGTLRALHQLQQLKVMPASLCWRGIFQPAEESNEGALEMIQAGAVDEVSAVLSLHVDPSRPFGRIGVREGVFTAACDEINIRIQGRGGHAARPHESIDPVAAAAQLISSIYLFVPRSVDSQDPVVITFGQIQGGNSANAIPSQVLVRGTLRTLGGSVREHAKRHIKQLASGLEQAAGTRIEIEFLPGPESVVNCVDLCRLIRQAGHELLGPANVDELTRPSMGGEDFAHYGSKSPICMFRLGCAGDGHPLHSPLFDIDERSLALGAKLLCRAAILWACQHCS
ncbi:MAG: peptidase M20 [Gemmatales bacterium]|nr:MAG: peptidase M20 [Gemmatales bacterium]